MLHKKIYIITVKGTTHINNLTEKVGSINPEDIKSLNTEIVHTISTSMSKC